MTVALCLIIAFVAIQNNDAFAECKAKAGCYAEDDTGYPVLCESGSYDPCDSWFSWDVYFHRNNYHIQTSTTFEVQYSGWARTYSAYVYSPGDYHFSGTHFAGTSSKHNARIVRTYGTGGTFEDLTLAVTYYADDPTK